MAWDYQCTAFRNDCTGQFSIGCNCIHSEKEGTTGQSEDLVWHISGHFMDSGISKMWAVTLSYPSLSHCTGSYTGSRLDRQLHLSWISWTGPGSRWQTDWNGGRDHDARSLWRAEPSITVHETWQVQPYGLFKGVSTTTTAPHNCEQEQIPNILMEWEWALCDEAGEWCWGGNVQWMGGLIQFFSDLEVLCSHQCWGGWDHTDLQIHSQVYIQGWRLHNPLFQWNQSGWGCRVSEQMLYWADAGCISDVEVFMV